MNEEFYGLIERSIDVAFEEDKYLFRCYDYLKSTKTKRKEVREFIESTTANPINGLISELDEYIKGGADSDHKQLREGYGHIPKPQARKIKTYLYGILEDARRYSYDRRPGRRKKQSK